MIHDDEDADADEDEDDAVADNDVEDDDVKDDEVKEDYVEDGEVEDDDVEGDDDEDDIAEDEAPWEDLCKRPLGKISAIEIYAEGVLARSLHEISVEALYSSSLGKIYARDFLARSL
eukprot:s85_g40.t1